MGRFIVQPCPPAASAAVRARADAAGPGARPRAGRTRRAPTHCVGVGTTTFSVVRPATSPSNPVTVSKTRDPTTCGPSRALARCRAAAIAASIRARCASRSCRVRSRMRSSASLTFAAFHASCHRLADPYRRTRIQRQVAAQRTRHTQRLCERALFGVHPLLTIAQQHPDAVWLSHVSRLTVAT
jgi:hypothetical protein